APALDLLLELGEPPLPVARVPGAVEDEAVRVALLELRVPGRRVEALLEEVQEVRRLEDRDVDVALDEEVLEQVLLAVLLVLLPRPDVLGRREPGVVVVEAGDPALAVVVLLVLRAAVPPVDVPVDDEVLVARRAAVHVLPPLIG